MFVYILRVHSIVVSFFRHIWLGCIDVCSVALLYVVTMGTNCDFEEQRIVMKFLVKAGKTNTEIFKMMKPVYKDDMVKRSAFLKWLARFREGRTSTKDDDRSGRPSTSRTDLSVQKVEEAINANRRLTVRDVAEVTGINRETVRLILTEDLGMTKLCAKVVPKNLTAEQKENRLRICQDWLENSDIFTNVITGDESWIYEYDPETKKQSMEWKKTGEPRTKKARMSKSKIKAMMMVFFDSRGIVLLEWVPQGQTVNSVYYLGVMKRLRERVRRKRPDLWQNQSWVLHHDNAPSHTALIVRQFLAKTSTTVLEHPPYSPDLAPCDFFLFPKIKEKLKGHHFQTLEYIKEATTEALAEVTKDQFRESIEGWKVRMEKCIRAQGEYFEGCNV